MTTERLRPSFSFTAERLAELRAVVPEAFADGRLNWETLKEALGEWAEPDSGEAEHFGLFWPGKREARRLAATPSRGTLTPVTGDGVNEADAGNLFIEGDNLEVLKLLQKSYSGRVKVIYIDPPYNTGNDFVYKDDFRDPLGEYLRRAGLADEAGRALTTNTRADGRFHSNWLSMMYPRLRLAKSLLTSDGVILVSVDDNEVHNLRAIMGEIFGEENFVGCVVWERKRKGSHLSRKLTQKTEYIVIFGRSGGGVELYGEPVGEDEDAPLVKRTNAIKELTLPAGSIETSLPDGRFEAGRYGSGTSSVELLAPVEVSGGRFASLTRLKGPFVWSQAKVDDELSRGGRFFIRTNNFSLRALKADQASGFKALSSLLTKEVGTNEDAKTELAALLGVAEDELPIDYPKPVSLLKTLIKAATFRESDRDAIVMDFFAGSATTGHATLALNREDGFNRRFVCVQMDAPIDREDFPSIVSVGKERLRRAIAHIGGASESVQGGGPGFRVFRLRPSNFRAWEDYDGENMGQLEAHFDDAATPLLAGWTPEALLSEILLLHGFPLDSRIEPQSAIEHNRVWLVTTTSISHRLWVCLDGNVHKTTTALLRPSPEDTLVCLDSAIDDETKLRLADLCHLETV